jgi:hypothetical protein
VSQFIKVSSRFRDYELSFCFCCCSINKTANFEIRSTKKKKKKKKIVLDGEWATGLPR